MKRMSVWEPCKFSREAWEPSGNRVGVLPGPILATTNHRFARFERIGIP